MGFIYSREKNKFEETWRLLRAEYQAAGMSPEAIDELHDYDWTWFKRQRAFRNRIQELPSEGIGDKGGQSQSSLINKFKSMVTTFDEADFSGRYAWVDEIEDKDVAIKLKQLSIKDLELLTLYAIDGYSELAIALRQGCSQSNISQKLARLKKYFK